MSVQYRWHALVQPFQSQPRRHCLQLYRGHQDAFSNGLSYTYTLVIVAVVREALGFGTVLGIRVMPAGFTNWVVMAMAPGAFFVLAVFIWISRSIAGMEE